MIRRQLSLIAYITYITYGYYSKKNGLDLSKYEKKKK